MTQITLTHILPIVMLLASNVFMTFAWYGHLSYGSKPIWVVVMVSWGIAFFEYWLAVPANRIGHQVYSAAQLKTMQEIITFAVFIGFSVFFLKESISAKQVLGFAIMIAGSALVLRT